jgi:addiction module HigA family antidote
MSDILNRRKRRPTHPGELIRDELLPQFGLSQGELADAIGVSRRTVNEVLTERRGLSVDMGYRFGRLFQVSPGLLIRMQEAVDVWDTLRANGKDYARIRPARQLPPAARTETNA